MRYCYGKYYGGLGYGLGGFSGLGYIYGFSCGLGDLTVMAVATLIPLSVEDTDHLDSSEELDHYFETQNVCLISIIQYNNSSKKIWPCTWNSLNQLIFLPLMNDSNALFR